MAPQKNKKAAGRKTVPRKAANKIPAAKSPGKSADSRPGRETAKTTTREKLTAVKPSGKKDDSFFELVHEVARQIPRGRVTSYGAIGACLGLRSSARMVGWAMNVSHRGRRPVPAHRVVNSIGLLTGRHHFNPPEAMQQLLEKEGVKVKDNKVVDFKKIFWDPSQEL